MALTRTGFVLLVVVIVLLVIYVFPVHIHTRQLVPPSGVMPGFGGSHAHERVMHSGLNYRSVNTGFGSGVPVIGHAGSAAHVAGLHTSGVAPTENSLSSYLWQSSNDILKRASAVGHPNNARFPTGHIGGFRQASLSDACYCYHAAHVMKLAAHRAGPTGVSSVLSHESDRLARYAQNVMTMQGITNGVTKCASELSPNDAYIQFQKRVGELLPPVYSVIAALPRATLRTDINAHNAVHGSNLARYVDTLVAHNPALVDKNIALSVFQEAADLEVRNMNAA